MAEIRAIMDGPHTALPVKTRGIRASSIRMASASSTRAMGEE